MGDEAEGKFEEFAAEHGISIARLGLNRPPFEYFYNLPVQVRYLPDYIVEDTKRSIRDNKGPFSYAHALVEVKGVGKAQTVKIKSEMLLINKSLEDFFKRQVVYFIWDSFNKRMSFSHSNRMLIDMIEQEGIQEKQFKEGTRYYPVPTELFKWEGSDVNE